MVEVGAVERELRSDTRRETDKWDDLGVDRRIVRR